jgi:hypothetical protein
VSKEFAFVPHILSTRADFWSIHLDHSSSIIKSRLVKTFECPFVCKVIGWVQDSHLVKILQVHIINHESIENNHLQRMNATRWYE